MNTMRISLLVCAIVAFANFASAQDQGPGRGRGPRPKPEMTTWWDQPIARDLGLSDEQNRQIRATVAESRDRLIQLRGAVDNAEAVLRDVMDEERVDARRGQEAIEQVVTTRSEMLRAVAQMSLKLRVILTSAQWQELQKRESQPPPPLPGQPQRKKVQE
jgi:Spy/CpxP family protein refolding chaperone